MKGSLLFILGAAVGIFGYVLADSPIDPFHNWIESKDCQRYYAEHFNITEEEFVKRLEQINQ
jgi:hypothetical protein